MELSPEEKKRIYEEEKVRFKVQEKLKEESEAKKKKEEDENNKGGSRIKSKENKPKKSSFWNTLGGIIFILWVLRRLGIIDF